MASLDNSKPLRLLLVGASGVVGQQVLKQALADTRIAQVVAVTRKALPEHPKLENPVSDFSNLLADASYWKVDAVICTLGTTIKQAGTQAAFAAVDRDLPIEIARLARNAGATCFALNGEVTTFQRYLKTTVKKLLFLWLEKLSLEVNKVRVANVLSANN